MPVTLSTHNGLDHPGLIVGGVMSNRLTYRIMGLLGILNLALLVIPMLIAPIPPLEVGADLVAFNLTYRGALMAGNYLAVVQLPVGLILLTFVAALTRRAEITPDGWHWMAVFALGICAVCVLSLPLFLYISAPLIAHLGKETLTLMLQLSLYSVDVYYLIQGTVLAAIAIAVLRLHHMPAWLGYLAALAGAVSALGSLGLVVASGPLSATGFITVFGGGFSLPGWLFAAGLFWLFHPEPGFASTSGVRRGTHP